MPLHFESKPRIRYFKRSESENFCNVIQIANRCRDCFATSSSSIYVHAGPASTIMRCYEIPLSTSASWQVAVGLNSRGGKEKEETGNAKDR